MENDESLKKLVEELHFKAKEGLITEKDKTELKSIWYKLAGDTSDKVAVSKFLLAVASIANTVGPTGYLIIGIDEKTGSITSSPFKESGLRDPLHLHALIAKGIDRSVSFSLSEIETEVDGTPKIVSVITIPPSLEKPHVILEYTSKNGHPIKQYVPVRKGPGVYPASRHDLEMMYYDRKNITPEYALNVRTYKGSVITIRPAGASVSLDIPIIFENSGRKPVILIKCQFVITQVNNIELDEGLVFQLGAYSTDSNMNIDISKHPIILPSNEASSYLCNFYTWEVTEYDAIRTGKVTGFFLAEDAVGNKYESSLFRTDEFFTPVSA